METLSRDIYLVHWVSPAVPALIFVLAMSLVREPARQRLNAVIAGGFAALYINGGLGLWEFAYSALATVPAYLGLRSYRFIGVAWLMHTGWDLVHHFYGNPLWHWSEMSSFGCAVMDALVAVWFLAGAPSVYALLRRRTVAVSALLFLTSLGGVAHAGGELAVVVTGVRAPQGSVRALLWSQADGFPSDAEKAMARTSARAAAETVTLVFPNVAPGHYAVSVIHDRDDDGELDTNWVGVPREAVGISNGAIGFLGPGRFEEALISVDESRAQVPVELYHW